MRILYPLLAALLLSMMLAACSLPGRSDRSTPAAATPFSSPGHSDRSTPATATPFSSPSLPDEMPTETAEPIVSCVVGDWKLIDASAYYITSMESAGIESEYLYSTGEARYLFAVDGVFWFEANQFTQEVTIKSSVAVPLTFFMDGVGTARYSVEDGRLIFSNPSSEGLVVQATVFGDTIDLDFWGAPEGASEVAFLYECVGHEKLLLTPPLNDYAVFPLQLERVH